VIPNPPQSDRRESVLERHNPIPAGGPTPESIATTQVHSVDPLGIALGLLAGLLVYANYFPSDAVAVEKGDALWFAMIALIIAAITFAFAANHNEALGLTRQPARRRSVLIDMLAWSIALWVMLGAFNLSPPGSLRTATNEGWLWIAGASVFTSARRLFVADDARRAILVLILAGASGLAVHGLHQHYVSLPQNRLEYQRDPDAVLDQAGIYAPAGSTERMVFENRLNDGGATATFSLANSLAAVLLIGVAAGIGVLKCGWPLRTTTTRWSWFCCASIVATGLSGACLLATASRSAIAATLVSLVCLIVLMKAGRSIVSLLGVALAAVLLLVGVASLGNPEWFQQAPASLSFRFQYWRSTMELAFQNPWFGAGPGNFQSVYERFREDSAHEQIADPHNLFFETLGSGGFVAAALLVVLIALLARTIAGRISLQADGGTFDRSAETIPPGKCVLCKWIWLGSGLGLVLIWLLSFSTGMLPDIEAHLFAVPVAIIVAVLLWPTVRSIHARNLDVLSASCLAGLGVHLMAAGGWTVPGVAIYLWLFAGMLTRCDAPPDSRPDKPRLLARLSSRAASAAMVMLAASLYFVSIIPVQRAASALAAANVARGRGQWPMIQEKLDEAIRRDPWSVEAHIQKADLMRWALVVAEPNPNTRSEWELAVDATKRIAGQNPTVYESLGQQQIHVYQRHGNVRDLRAALQTFRNATDWSRANEGLYAQLALIEAKAGNQSAAEQAAARASELANAGGLYERILQKQLIAVVEPIGRNVQRRIRQDFAGELLRNLLPKPNVDSDPNLNPSAADETP
tara:strand:- start:286056 stop:288464 length:2409 start_codon:yes stop_codon:yes gene_type:complete